MTADSVAGLARAQVRDRHTDLLYNLKGKQVRPAGGLHSWGRRNEGDNLDSVFLTAPLLQ